jgi:hypothetical protein
MSLPPDPRDAVHRNFVPGEDLADFRTRVRQAQAAATAERARELVEQGSALHAPAVRIRLWERLHHTRLPVHPDHGLVRIIAAATNLTVAEIHAEQERRTVRPAPAG